jgi:hypothetical protein
MWQGEVHVIGPGGEEIQPVGGVLSFPANAHVTTGPSGHIQILLADETVFTIGPSGEMVLDDFVYDPSTSASKYAARIIKGLFRILTGSVQGHRHDLKVQLPIGDLGFRGTDVEIEVQPGGAGTIKIYSGAVTLTRSDTGDVIEIASPAMFTFDEAGRIIGPLPLPSM